MAALGLFVYGSVAIFLVDNLLRPMIIGSIARLPVLFMLLSILGGLLAYGPLGLFLGPVLLAIGMAVGGVYREIVGAS
jgi:predicted PurR-regulated permease PerM